MEYIRRGIQNIVKGEPFYDVFVSRLIYMYSISKDNNPIFFLSGNSK